MRWQLEVVKRWMRIPTALTWDERDEVGVDAEVRKRRTKRGVMDPENGSAEGLHNGSRAKSEGFLQ